MTSVLELFTVHVGRACREASPPPPFEGIVAENGLEALRLQAPADS